MNGYTEYKTPFGVGAYLEYADAKGRAARLAVETNRAERARMRRIEACLPFDGTLYMSKNELRKARLSGLGIKGAQ